jgi:hypothetical protein
MSVLVTGGAGYIGSHTVVELLNAGQEVVIVDNYSNSKPEVLNRIETITGKAPTFYEVDVLDREALDAVFRKRGYRLGHPFRGLQSSRRIRGETDRILPQQHHELFGAVRCDAQPRREEDRLQLFGDGLRHEQRVTADGRPADKRNEPLRLHESDDRTDPPGRGSFRFRVEHRFAALLQPDRRA